MKTGFPFLTFAKTEVFHEFGWSVAKPDWDWLVWRFAGEIHRLIPSIGGVAILLGFTKGDASVGKNQTGFWHANAFDGLETGGG